jgi:hypothetical protein
MDGARTNLYAEIAAEGDVVGALALGEEVPRGNGRRAALEHDLALPLVEVGCERGEVELGEERPLQSGVDAVHGAELPLLHLVVQQAPVARRLHPPSLKNSRTLQKPPPTRRFVASPLRIADSSRD